MKIFRFVDNKVRIRTPDSSECRWFKQDPYLDHMKDYYLNEIFFDYLHAIAH